MLGVPLASDAAYSAFGYQSISEWKQGFPAFWPKVLIYVQTILPQQTGKCQTPWIPVGHGNEGKTSSGRKEGGLSPDSPVFLIRCQEHHYGI